MASPDRTPLVTFYRVCTKTADGESTIPDLQRTPIPGGWLVALGKNGGLVTVNDPDHKWLARKPQPAPAAQERSTVKTSSTALAVSIPGKKKKKTKKRS